MAQSFLDSLLFNSVKPKGVPLPSPNPLRMPEEQPQLGGGMDFLSSILQLPSLPSIITGGENILDKKVKDERATSEARQRYNSPEVQMPLPERRTGQNSSPSGEATPASGDDETPDLGDEENTPPLPEQNPLTSGASSPSRGPDGQIRVPYRQTAPVADPLKAMMLQMALQLMTPSWGNTMSQIGQAVGGGASAAGRATQLNEAEARRVENEADSDEDRGLKRRATEASIAKTEAETKEIASGESSRSRRLRGKQPTIVDEAATAANLGPKGKLYLAQRLKTLNKDDLLGEEDEDPTAKFNKILSEAQKLDAPSAPAKAPNVGGTETATSLPIIKTPEEAKKLTSKTKFLFEDPKTKQLTIGTAP